MNKIKEFCKTVIEEKFFKLSEVDCNGITCSECPFSFRNNKITYCFDLSPKQIIELGEKYIKEAKVNIQIGDIIKAKHLEIPDHYFIVKRVCMELDTNTIFYECELINSNGVFSIFRLYDSDILEVFSKQ